MNAVKEKAPAKINLFLDVVAKRADGFHDIRTVIIAEHQHHTDAGKADSIVKIHIHNIHLL